jgi:transcriptional regulator with GAF, ATPase, and Fis domain
MQVNYRTGHTGPLLIGDEIPLVEPTPDTVLITGSSATGVRVAARAVADAAKKKRRRRAASSRRANRT